MCLENIKKVNGRNNKGFPKCGTYYKVVNRGRGSEFYGAHIYDKGTYTSEEGPGFHCFRTRKGAQAWRSTYQEIIRVRVRREDIVGMGIQARFNLPCILAKKIRVID